MDPKTTTCLTPPRPVLACKSSDGTAKNQTCKDEGPLTLERSKTVDEEISAKVIDFLDRNDPKKTNKPFFVWYNPARMHITTVLSPKYEAMIGRSGGKDWGVNEAGMKQMDDNIGYVLKKLEDMGQLDNTIVVFTTDNGAEVITFPDGGVTPFKGGKLTTWEGGMRAPLVIRWPGHIKPGTVKNEMFSSLDWVPTFVDIAGGPKGDGLKKQIEAGKYPGIVKTTLDGVDQRDYLEGKSEQVGARYLLLLHGLDAVGGALQELEVLLHDGARHRDRRLFGAQTYHWTQIANIKRDPFEQTVGADAKSLLGYAGSLGSPSTAYLYDWNMLPIGKTPQKPNILVIMGDDIGYWNISAYNRGMMGYRTPNIDRIAKEGAIFTDYYGQQSCTAGRAAFITGQSPMRTGLLKVGLPGAKEGLSEKGPDARRAAQAAGLRDRPVRQEPSRRPQRVPADRARLRRVLRQPLPPQCRGGAGAPRLSQEPGVQRQVRPARRAAVHGDHGQDDARRRTRASANGASRTCEDTGPLTKKRMETVDEEFLGATLDFIDRANRDKKPFFVWFNPSRMHIWTRLKPESEGKTGPWRLSRRHGRA